MSAPADRPRLVEKADTQSEIWKYFAYAANSKGKPTDTAKPVCKRCFKSVMTKEANTSVSLCSVTVCHCETTPTLTAGSEGSREKLHTDTLLRFCTKFIKYRY